MRLLVLVKDLGGRDARGEVKKAQMIIISIT